MCQLLGMNCNTPTDICFSFEGFRTRGGLTDIHRDGWGIAFFEGTGCRVFLDVEPSAHSAVAELVHNYPIRSKNVVAHIRKATQGTIALENTHPFQRELWGRYWIFAHNGNLKDFAPATKGSYTPVGDTDSELAFCHILESLRARFPEGRPQQDELFAALAELSTRISVHGEFNFLLSCGDCLFAHCGSKLCYIVRKAPFAVAHLKDQDVSVDFSEVTNPDDRVAVIATLPLTDNEDWTTLTAGTLTQFHDGLPVRSASTAT
jgi:glutamine amidotransferase